MKTAIASRLPVLDPAIADDARVWIYQSDRPFTPEELLEIERACDEFVSGWHAHGNDLNAFSTVLYNRFIALFVNPGEMVSGCSIDSSVHFITSLEKKLGLSLTNRTMVAFLDEEQQVQNLHISELSTAYESGEITDDTLVFDNLVFTKGEMEERWLKPLGTSWHKRMLP